MEKKDLLQLTLLAKKHNLNFPSEGKVFVCEDSEGKIKACTNVRMVLFIEPFIAEDPISGKRLWDFVEKKIKENKVRIIRCFARKENIELYEKIGFYKIFSDHISMEKNFIGDK